MWEFPIDEGLVLARPDIHGLFLLNLSARLIWSEFRRGISQVDIVAEFAAHFCVSSDVARRDIEATMASWHQGLLAPPPSPAVFPPSVIGGTEVCPIDCVVNGTPMRVLLESGDVWDEIAPRLEPVRADNLCPRLTFTVGSAASRVLVFRDDLCIGNEENTAAARIILLQAMAALGERLAILHAGCCGGILLAGESQSGKSTLCAALMRRGLSYHCDDSAVLDHEFRVAPMPFPIMLRSGSWPLLQTRFPELEDAPVYNRWGINVRFLPLVPASDPTLVTALVFVRHEAEAGTQIGEISVLDTLLALQRTGFWVDHTPESIERFLGWVARIRRYNLHYAELEEAERIIGELAALRANMSETLLDR